jgi:hypothetical protein
LDLISDYAHIVSFLQAAEVGDCDCAGSPLLHVDLYVVDHCGVPSALDLGSCRGTADSAGSRGGVLATSGADLVAQHTANDGAGNGCGGRGITFYLAGADVTHRAAIGATGLGFALTARAENRCTAGKQNAYEAFAEEA